MPVASLLSWQQLPWLYMCYMVILLGDSAGV